MTHIKALVVYPVNISFELPTEHVAKEQLTDFIWKNILTQADKQIFTGTVAPVIVSSDPEIPALYQVFQEKLETQADWTLLALQTLQKIQPILQTALTAKAVLKPTISDKLVKLNQDLSELVKNLIISIGPTGLQTEEEFNI